MGRELYIAALYAVITGIPAILQPYEARLPGCNGNRRTCKRPEKRMLKKKHTIQETGDCFAKGASYRQRRRQIGKEIATAQKDGHRFAHGSCILTSEH
jgi:hypothetical protein